MANVLRYQTGSGRNRPFVGGLEPLDERGEPMPAPPNASGILERNVIPEGDGGQFQLTSPGDLSMQPRDDTPTLDRLTLRNAPNPRLDYGQRRLSMVEGLPDVPPEPAMGPAPERAWGGPSSQDARDSRRTQRIDRAQAFAEFGERIGQLFQRPEDRQAPEQGGAQWSAPITARMDARQAMGAASQGGKIKAEQAAYDRQVGEGERALNADYRRTLMRSMDTNADRREFEMGRRTDADSRLYDPAHPVAQQRREFLRRIMASAPEIAAGLEGQDLDALGSAELRQVTSETLRRIGQTPNRLRQADVDAMMRMAAELDAGDDAVSAAPVAEPVQDVPRGSGPRRAGAQAVTPAPDPNDPEAIARATISQLEGQQVPRRDRTVAQINADRLMERRGRRPPSGYSADDLTPGEALRIASSIERRGNQAGAARIAGGIDTQSREAQMQQVEQQGSFTENDVRRAALVLAPAASMGRQLAGIRRRGAALSDAEFMLAMNDNALLTRILGNVNTENFMADFRAMTNNELRQQSGAAVTDSEAARFFSALSARRFSSKQAFLHALERVDRERRQSVAAAGVRPDVYSAWSDRTLAAAQGGRRQ